jgi:hypothetical protein
VRIVVAGSYSKLGPAICKAGVENHSTAMVACDVYVSLDDSEDVIGAWNK